MVFVLFSQPHVGDGMGLLVFLIVVPLAIKLVLSIIAQALFQLIWLIVSAVAGGMLYLIRKIFSRKTRRLFFPEMETVPIENEMR